MTVPCPSQGSVSGWIIGESTAEKSTVLFHPQVTPRTGMYLLVETSEGCVLGIVERVYSGNLILGDKIRDSDELQALTQYPSFHSRTYRYGVVQWLSLLTPLTTHYKVVSPSTPPDPGSTVEIAPTSVLNHIFQGNSQSWIRIGRLISDSNVGFSIDVNKLSRHLAILAVTGGGKSNTVCVLSHKIVNDLDGTVVLFDIHGEYRHSNTPLVPGKTSVKEPKINPVNLSFPELRRLARIPENAHVQERILRVAWKNLVNDLNKGALQLDPNKSFLRYLEDYSVRAAIEVEADKKSLLGLLNRLSDIEDYYGDVLDLTAPRDLKSYVEPGKLNIIDLSSVDEFGADAVVSHYLRRLLEERKLWKNTRESRGYPVPVIAVVEEAHVLIPRDKDTLSKYWAGRVAREGRKFGLGLVLVSQRPKNVDQDVLSQTNNKIILKIVEPQDQRYVQAASEQLSEDLMRLLPSLNPGEAVVIGSMTKIPALVRIDMCQVQTGGSDIPFDLEWQKYKQQSPGIVSEEELTEELASL